MTQTQVKDAEYIKHMNNKGSDHPTEMIEYFVDQVIQCSFFNS